MGFSKKENVKSTGATLFDSPGSCVVLFFHALERCDHLQTMVLTPKQFRETQSVFSLDSSRHKKYFVSVSEQTRITVRYLHSGLIKARLFY